MDRNTPKDKYGYAFDPNSVANLKKIIDETGADIVISSSWKSKRVLFLNSFLKKSTKQYKGEIETARKILDKYI